MMASSSRDNNNSDGTWGTASGEIRGPELQAKCTIEAAVKVDRSFDAVHDTADNASDAKEDSPFNEDRATTVTSVTSSQHDTEKYVQHWEQEALSHFRNSSWEDVIHACEKVLKVPGQSKMNFNVLYEIGYAHMRLEEYETAAAYLMGAHRIDSQRVTLRLVMMELRRKISTGPWRNRGRKGVRELQHDSKKTCTSEPRV